MLKLEKHKTEQSQKEQKVQSLTISKQEKEIERLNAELELIKKETVCFPESFKRPFHTIYFLSPPPTPVPCRAHLVQEKNFLSKSA